MKRSYIYIAVLLVVYGLFVIVFTTFPRSTFSQLEKRKLVSFPLPSLYNIKNGTFTNGVSKWFSDTEPYRDDFMALSMTFEDLMKLRIFGATQSDVKFHAAKGNKSEGDDYDINDEEIEEYTNNITANDNAKKSRRGIIISGEGPNVRAFSAYGGGPEGGGPFAKACNEYYKAFGNQATIYCLVVPSAVEFYCPDAAKSITKPELPTIKAIHERLDDGVVPVNAYSPLANHAKEPIFSRTDHHWAPLGAYYVAQEFARVAKVPFRDLSHYDKKVIHGFVGSMYGYSHDISIKNAPEDFIYYVPRGVTYTTTYVKYNSNHRESAPETGEFFQYFPDGSSAAYCTFMGGDNKITHVNTSTKNGRRLLLIKDSFGNALPGYLFYSFEDIHVVDFRYFSRNMRKYVNDNHITDIILLSGIFRAYSQGEGLIKFIDQPDGTRPASDGSKSAQNDKKPKRKSSKSRK